MLDPVFIKDNHIFLYLTYLYNISKLETVKAFTT